MKNWLRLLCCASCSVALGYQFPATGAIGGIVLTAGGHPLAGAAVDADRIDGGAKALPIRYVETDKNGRFLIDKLDWGVYAVHAKKEEDEYPDTRWSFYSKASPPKVRLTPQSRTQQVTIALGPKAGVIAGAISDAATGGPLNASFRMWRARDPDNFFGTSAKSQYRTLVPANVEVGIEVSAPGYEDWYYPGVGDASKAGSVVLRSGEEMTIDVRLQPKP